MYVGYLKHMARVHELRVEQVVYILENMVFKVIFHKVMMFRR